MCHEKEIPSLVHGYATVDHCSRLDVAAALLIGCCFACGIESVMVLFANDNEGDLWLERGLKDFMTSSPNGGYLFTQHNWVLALRNAYEVHPSLV